MFQIGSIGLLKAVDKFDLSYDVKFSTYAVPMISGEINVFSGRRHDKSQPVHERKSAIRRIWPERNWRKKWQRSSDPGGGDEIGIPEEELIQALDSGAEIESCRKRFYQGEEMTSVSGSAGREQRPAGGVSDGFCWKKSWDSWHPGEKTDLYEIFSGADPRRRSPGNWESRRFRYPGWKRRF